MAFILAHQLNATARPPYPPPHFPLGTLQIPFEDYHNGAVPQTYQSADRPERYPSSPPSPPELLLDEPRPEFDTIPVAEWLTAPTELFRDSGASV